MRTMTRLSLLLVAFFLAPRVVQAEVLRVTVDSVSLRNQPATSGTVVGTVTKGMLLDVIAKHGYWNHVQVRSTGELGYIHSAFVEEDPGQAAGRPQANRSPSPPPDDRTYQQRLQPREPETGHRDVGSFGLGGYIWDGASNVAFSPVLDLSEHASLLGTFDTTAIAGIRVYMLTGNFLYRFSVRGGSSPVTFEPYLGGGAGFASIADIKLKGFTILGGTFLKFESFPHLKFSGGLMHVETVGETYSSSSFSLAGSTLMVGAHYFF